MNTQLYWLVSGQVVTANRTGTEHSKRLNCLVKTSTDYFSRKNLAQAQETLSRRFVEGCPQIPGFKIIDVYIESLSVMGSMTDEQFNEGMNVPEEVKN